MKKKTICILMMACVALLWFSCHKEEETETIPPEGALTHAFSVSSTKKVYFAKGNLQYRASTDTWRFAENQWDTIGSANMNRSSTYDGWIDLFYYGTSGYNNCFPYNYYYISYSGSYGNYYSNKELPDYDISVTNYDWGNYNPICNAGNKVGLWRILTVEEWIYLLYERYFLSPPFSLGSLVLSENSQIVGVFVFPDDCYWYTYTGNNTYPPGDMIEMTLEDLETSGAMFLPYVGNITGVHHGSEIYMRYENNRACFYWTGSNDLIYENTASCLQFNDHYLWTPMKEYGQGTWNAGGVRLVRDCN